MEPVTTQEHLKESSLERLELEKQPDLPQETLVEEKSIVRERGGVDAQDGGVEIASEQSPCPEDNIFCKPYSRFLFLEQMNLCNGKPCKREIGELTLHPEGILFSMMEEYQAFNRTAKGIMVTWKGNVRFSYTYDLYRNQMRNLFGFTHITLNKEPESFLSIAIPPTDHHQRRLRAVAKRSIKTGKRYKDWRNFLFTTAFRPAVDEEKGQIIVVEKIQKLSSFSLKDGSKRWELPHSSDWVCSPVIDKQSRIFMCDKQGYLYCFSDQGKLLWKRFFLTGFPIKTLSFTRTYIGLNSAGYVYLTDSRYTKVYTSKGLLVLKLDKRMDRKFVVASDSTMLFGSGPFLYTAQPKNRVASQRWAQIPYAQIPYHPMLFVDGSLLYKDSSSGIYRYGKDGALMTRFLQKKGRYYYLRLPQPRQLFLPGGMGMVVRENGTLYAKAHYATSPKSSDEHVGILEIRLRLPKLDKKGWPTVNGLFSNKRSFR